MTTYAPNFTPRLKVSYFNGKINHSIQVRNVRGTSFADMQFMTGRIHDLFQLVSGNLYTDFQFVSSEIALTDSDVFLPTANPAAITGMTILPSAASAKARIQALTFTGKAPGSHARFSIFGFSIGTDLAADVGGDGKITSVEMAVVASVATLASANFKAGSGSAAIFPNVATLKPNDRLLRLVRKGVIS